MNLGSSICFFVMSLLVLTTAVEYRLPKTVVPVNYDVNITLDENAFTSQQFRGQINITLNMLNTTGEIKIHSKNLTIINMTLVNETKSYNLTNQNFTSDPLTHILNVIITEGVSPGRYYLLVTYNGTLSSHEFYGLYKSTYKNESGSAENLAVTQLAITEARRAFPCFDEPELKATFNLSVVYPKGYNVMANTGPSKSAEEVSPNLETINFKPTPVMSTYLVALIISNFTCSTSTESTIRVCSRPGTDLDRRYALEIAPKIVKALEDFTGVPYNTSGLTKLDLVAIPDFSYTAMENWGVITFKERALLWNESTSTNYYQQTVATIIAHEIAHQWFGDLVTTKWWSDTFLNEGFATYFEYFTTAEVLNDWELDQQFVIEQMHTALVADSSESELPLSYNVNTDQEILARFNVISYNKGGCVIRMIAHTMGLDKFKQGVQDYLQKHKFNNTLADDLWSDLEVAYGQASPSLKVLATNWTYHAGYPLLNVTRNGTNITITQKRFLLSGQNSTKWYVPITYTTSQSVDKFNSTSPRVWLSPHDSSITLVNVTINASDWIILNNLQTGYYRVNYDDDLWNRIRAVLRNNISEVHVINRAQIVDDLFNFALAGRVSYSRVFDIISFLENDTDYYSWYSAFTGFSKLLPKISSSTVQQRLRSHLAQLMTKLYESVPFNTENISNQMYTLKQAMAIEWACKLDNSSCLRETSQMFSSYKNGTNPRKNLLLPVLCTSLRHSNNTEQDWDFLWNEFTKSNVASHQVIILSALGCTKNHTLLTRYLQLAFNTTSEIRRHDSSLVYSTVINSGPDGVNVSLQFLNESYEQICDFYRDNTSISALIGPLANVVNDRSQIDKLSTLIQSGKLAESVKNITEATIKLAEATLIKNKKIESEIEEYFYGTKSFATRKQATNMWLASAVLILIYWFY